jgi:hypothetical protein
VNSCPALPVTTAVAWFVKRLTHTPVLYTVAHILPPAVLLPELLLPSMLQLCVAGYPPARPARVPAMPASHDARDVPASALAAVEIACEHESLLLLRGCAAITYSAAAGAPAKLQTKILQLDLLNVRCRSLVDQEPRQSSARSPGSDYLAHSYGHMPCLLPHLCQLELLLGCCAAPAAAPPERSASRLVSECVPYSYTLPTKITDFLTLLMPNCYNCSHGDKAGGGAVVPSQGTPNPTCYSHSALQMP